MNTFDEIYAKIKEYPTIIIHRHISPDPDAIGSQAGLARAIKLAFPDKKVLCAGGDVGDLGWINTMDDVKDGDYQGALAITVDTADTPRVSDQRFKTADFVIKMDHHPNVDPYGVMNYVDENKPAASEIIADFILTEKLPLTAEVAYPIFAGIVGDTGRFMYPETSAHTFEIAAQLSKTGIDTNEICRNVSEVSLQEARLQNAVLNLMHVDPSGAAYATISQKQLKELGVTTEQANVTVSTPGRIKGIKAWNVFVELADGTYRVHYRSKGPVINQLAQNHNGGGHALASGAKAKDQAEVKQIFDELIAVTKQYRSDHD